MCYGVCLIDGVPWAMRMRRVGNRSGGWKMGPCRVLVMMATIVVAGFAAGPQESGDDTTSSAAISLSDAFRVARSLTWWGVDAAMETMGYGERKAEIQRR